MHILLFAILVIMFVFSVFFLAKAFSSLNRNEFEKYKYLGPFLLLIPSVLSWRGRGYLLLAVLLGGGVIFGINKLMEILS